jgi:hypothetical protein
MSVQIPPSGQKDSPPVRIDVGLTPQTTYGFSGVAEGGAEVREGYEVQVWLDPENPDNAAAARFGGREPGAKPDGKPADLTGAVAAISADGKTLTLETPSRVKNQPADRKDVRLTADSKTVFMGVPRSGAKPTQGYRADVWLGDGGDAKTVRFQVAQKEKGPDLSGPVQAVGDGGKAITLEVPSKIKGEGAKSREIRIAEAKVIYNNVPTGGAKPAEGYLARVWLEPGEEAVAVRVLLSKD